jgi:hypothetical protein
MKRTLLVVTMGALLACPAFAQSDPGPMPPPGPPGHGMLTSDERQELKTAHQAALQANPDLATEGKALRDQMEAYQKKLSAAMIAADPKVQPILAKMEAARPHHDGDDAPPPPPPPGQ